MTDFYIYASSQYGADKYPQNRADDFIIELPAKIALHDSWRVGVLDMQIRPRKGGPNVSAYVCCDAVLSSFANGLSVPILKPIHVRKGNNSMEFKNVQYVRLKPCVGTTQVRLSIIDAETFEPVSLLQGATRCTLHFKQQL